MLHKKCFYLILSIVVIIICIFLYYNLYFFQDFIPVSSLNDDWTNVYELEEKEYSRCIEITNHIMNENVYNVRYVNTNTNDINNMVQVKAGINKISKLEANSSFNIDIKRVSEPNWFIQKPECKVKLQGRNRHAKYKNKYTISFNVW